MKKIILLLIGLTMFSLNNKGQTWQSYPTMNTVWNYWCGDPGGNYLFFQEIIGDTTINNKDYVRLKVHENFQSMNSYPFVREENKIIYQYNPSDTSEFIIFNFNLGIGNIFYSPFCFDSLTVNSIDSILLENGQYRKRITLSKGVLTDTWVEGIGSLKFPINYFWGWETYGSLDCLYQDFQYLISTHCWYLGIDDSTFPKNNVINPNPITNESVIELNDIDSYELSVFNITGKMLFHKKYYSSDIPIGNLGLHAGIYSYVVNSSSKCFNGKFVVKP